MKVLALGLYLVFASCTSTGIRKAQGEAAANIYDAASAIEQGASKRLPLAAIKKQALLIIKINGNEYNAD